MGKEIKEIKEKCIRPGNAKSFDNYTDMPIKKLSKDIINNIAYFKDYF